MTQDDGAVLSQGEIDALLGDGPEAIDEVQQAVEAPFMQQAIVPQQALAPPFVPQQVSDLPPPPPLRKRPRSTPPIQELAPMKNVYMDQVMAQQAEVAKDLSPKRRKLSSAMPDAPAGMGGGGGHGPDVPAVDVRIKGWWRWKTVVVPPNAYVVHTRLGKKEPLHCGLGVSFDYDPKTDSFLVVPAAMQTIMISANCICKERQGILVQGYVQWTIDDFPRAYRKLDFSDPFEPMKVVNVQLREQAEAAIKDTVAVMSIDDVLTDKQPIIRELTERLRQLAEGDGSDDGLGLRIITVQIKEAVVSSTRLWESLQRGFRAERQKVARLAELEHQELVREREADAERTEAARRMKLEDELAAHRAKASAAAFDRDQAEKIRRAQVEAETLAELTEQETQRLKAAAELERVEAEAKLELERLRERARIELLAARQEVENAVTPANLQRQLIAALPTIARELPKPDELKAYNLGGADGLGPLVSGVSDLVERVRRPAE